MRDRKWRLGLCLRGRLLSRDLVEKLRDEGEEIEVKGDYGVDDICIAPCAGEVTGIERG